MPLLNGEIAYPSDQRNNSYICVALETDLDSANTLMATTQPLKSFHSDSLWKYTNGSSQNMIDIKRLNDNHATWVYFIESNISGHMLHKSLFL